MRPISLKWRISLLSAALLGGAIVTISIVAYCELYEATLNQVNSTLTVMADGIEAALRENENAVGEQESPVESLDLVTKHKTARERTTHYRVWSEGAALPIAVSDADESPFLNWIRQTPPDRQPSPGQTRFYPLGTPGSEYQAIWKRYHAGEDVMSIVVVTPSRRVYHELHEFVRVLLWLGAGLLLSLTIAAWYTIRWGLRPIRVTAERLGRITHRNVGRAWLDEQRPPEELRPFVDALRGMLDRLNQAMEKQKRFVADASHELRTPLAIIKSTLQTTQLSERTAGEYRQAIDETLGDLQRTEKLLEQLLTLARLDEASPSALADVDLTSLLRSVAESLDSLAAQGGGQVVCEALPPLHVHGHDGLLTQAFRNLVDNAVKHGPVGGTVRLFLEQETPGRVTVCVHDEGGDIPPEALGKLFDRFYRVDSSRTRSTGGTGLGLAITREIVLQHGGEISIRSDSQAGTRVSVSLPRQRPEA